MPLRAKQVTFLAAKLVLSTGVLVYLVRRLDLDQLRTNLFAVDPWMFLLALALVAIQTAILNGRWMLIMRSLDVSIELARRNAHPDDQPVVQPGVAIVGRR